MVDATGHGHLFVEKVPSVTVAALDETSHFPQPGFIACIVIGRSMRDDGSQRVRIDTQSTPVDGTRFDVLPEQLCELPREEEGR